jgi:uncharacterized membrane protein
MPHVLVVGESWFTHSVHQKGFDSFFTSEYVEGAQVFLGALRDRGHTVTYVPAHEIASRLPATAEGLESYDVVVISDVGANSFQLTPETFARSVPSPDRTELLRAYVERGGGLLMVGGYLTFTGIDAKARWGRTPLASRAAGRSARPGRPRGTARRGRAAGRRPARGGRRAGRDLAGSARAQRGDGTGRGGAARRVRGPSAAGVGGYGAGRSAAFTSDLAPHWAPPAFLDWKGYPELWDRLVRWLARTPVGEEAPVMV